MSQQSVYKLLKKKKRWMTTKEIQKETVSSASDNLRKMFKHGEILRKTIKIGNIKGYAWKI